MTSGRSYSALHASAFALLSFWVILVTHMVIYMSIYRSNLQNLLKCFATCRGYLARGVLFRGEGRQGDAERMFLQARYIAPKESRALVDRVIGPS